MSTPAGVVPFKKGETRILNQPEFSLIQVDSRDKTLCFLSKLRSHWIFAKVDAVFTNKTPDSRDFNQWKGGVDRICAKEFAMNRNFDGSDDNNNNKKDG